MDRYVRMVWVTVCVSGGAHLPFPTAPARSVVSYLLLLLRILPLGVPPSEVARLFLVFFFYIYIYIYYYIELEERSGWSGRPYEVAKVTCNT